MLQFVRTLANNKLFQIVLGILLAVGFVSFGASDITPSLGPLVKMKGGNITGQQFQTYYQKQLEQTNLQSLSLDQQQKLQLPQKILQQMVFEQLLLKTAKDMNLHLSNRVVAQAIKQNPDFADPTTGQFSKDRYLTVIRQNGQSEGTVIAQIKKELLIGWVKKYFDGLRFDTPSLATTWQGDNGQVTFSYLTLTTATLNAAPIKPPTDNDLQGFYNNSLAFYQKPNYRRFQILTLSAQAIKNAAAKKTVVTDQELKNAYAAASDNFLVPASYQFEQLLFSEKKTADEFHAARQNNPAPLGAQTTTGGKYNTITLGADDLLGYGFQPGDAVGKTSAVVETPFGFAIVRLIKKVGGGAKPLAAVAPGLRAQLLAQKTNQAINDIHRLVGDQLAAGKGFSTALQAAGITAGVITTTGFIDKQGRDQRGAVAQNQPYIDSILANGFDDGITTTPLIITDANNNGGLVAIALLDNQPPLLPTFDNIKTIVAQDWKKAQERAILLKEKATIDEEIAKARFDFIAYQQAKKIPTASFSFSQKQLLEGKMIFQNINNNVLLNILFAPAATSISGTTGKLFVMKQQPRKATSVANNADAGFKKQLQAVSAEGWLLNLYRVNNVTIDWSRLDKLFNSLPN